MTTTSAAGRPRDPDIDRRIARAALDVFADVGWAGFAMEAVARRAGIGKASLYLRWSSKEALLTDAVDARLRHVAGIDTGNAREDLVALAVQILDLYIAGGGRAMLRLSLEAAAIPAVAERHQAMVDARLHAANAIVKRGVDRGELRAGTSATLVLDTLVGAAMMRALTPTPEGRAEPVGDARGYAAELVDLLLRGAGNEHPVR